MTQTFHAMIVLKSVSREENGRLGDPNWSAVFNLHEDFDELVRGMVNEREVPSWARHNGDQLQRESRIHFRRLLGTFPTTTSGFQHWDFASSVRVLRAACLDVECRLPEDRCFRINSLQLLDWLQKEAWTEVRTRVFLTIPTCKALPAELVDQIFECTLDAEGIPLDPGVWETAMVDLPDGDGSSLQRLRMKTKEEYRCSNDLDWDPTWNGDECSENDAPPDDDEDDDIDRGDGDEDVAVGI